MGKIYMLAKFFEIIKHFISIGITYSELIEIKLVHILEA